MAESSLPPEDEPDIQPALKPDSHNFDLYPNSDSTQGLGKSALADEEGAGQDDPPPDNSGFYNPAGDNQEAESEDKPSSPRSALAAAETGAGGGALGGLYSAGEQPRSKGAKLRASLKKNRRKALIGGGVGGGIAALVVGGLLLIVPLKIEDIVQNLENHFFSTSEHDVDSETNNVFKHYMKDEIGPALARGECTDYVSRDCKLKIPIGSNPISNLYRVWNQAKIEKTLADTYGIELRLDPSTRIYYLKAPGITGEEKVGDETTGIGDEFDEADRGDIRAAISDALEKTTGWEKVMFRYKVGRLLEEKYGIKRCIIYCNQRDALSDKKDKALAGLTEKKAAAKIYLVQRVLMPLTAGRQIAFACLLSSSCMPDQTQSTTPEEGTTGELNGEPENPDTDTALRTKLVSLGAADGGDVSGAITEYGKLQTDGYAKDSVDEVLESSGISDLAEDEAEEEAEGSVPVIGWINTAANVINKLNNAGPTVKKLAYITTSAAAVSLYMEYRTYADEIHTGNVDPTELNSMVSSLGPGNTGGANDPEVGGTADATSTPLYQSLSGTGSSSSSSAVSVLDSVLPKTAYADSTKADPLDASSDYKCEDGKPVPAGKLVCSEEVLGGGSSSLNAVHAFLHKSYIAPLTTAAGLISNGPFSIVQKFVGGILGFVLSHLPGFSTITKLIGDAVNPFFKSLFNDVIPNPFSDNMSGGRTFDMMAAGADVAGNDYAHTGLGGRKLDPTDVADITNEQEAETQQQFSQEPFFARMFSTNTPDSLVSKVALDMPFSLQSTAESSFASLVTNPFGAITHGFASIFSGRVSAAATPQDDPFGVTQYGYTDSDIPADPEAYWNEHCSDGVDGATTQAWDNAAQGTTDENTGMPVNTSTDPCLLIEATAGSAGGLFDTSMLTPDDLADANGSSPSSTAPVATTPGSSGTSTDCTTATGNPKILCEAEQWNGIYYYYGGGHDSLSVFQASCPDLSNPPNNQASGKLASDGTSGNPSPCAVDCSGLVDLATDMAFGSQGVDMGGASVTGIQSSKYWKSISFSQLQPGDIVTRVTSQDQHTEIVDTYDSSSGALVTFGAHETGLQDGTVPSTTSAWTGAYRYIGPGSSY